MRHPNRHPRNSLTNATAKLLLAGAIVHTGPTIEGDCIANDWYYLYWRHVNNDKLTGKLAVRSGMVDRPSLTRAIDRLNDAH